MTHIHELSAERQLAAVRRRELSPGEITSHYLDRISRLDNHVGAFITVTAELAERQAQKAEERLVSDTPAELPPLLGLPLPVKDLDMVAGVRCTSGSSACAEQFASTDSAFVAELRHAGAVFLGKTNTPEFGLSCYTENDIAPAARTPWDLTRSAGGSSGGAAAAVAAGLAPVAQGSDGGGSIRIPASVCGLVGLKPTRGRVTAAPDGFDLLGLAVAGPIARTVADAALVLDTMAGNRPGDYYVPPPLPAGETFRSYAAREPGQLRVARFCRTHVPGVELHPDVVAAYDDATGALTALGHHVEEITLPFDPSLAERFTVVWAAMAATAPVPEQGEDLLRPLTRWLRERATRTSAADYVHAAMGVQQAVRSAMSVLQDYDAVLTPTLAAPPVPVGYFTAGGDVAEEFQRMMAFTPFTAMYNLTGQPAVSLPLYWNAAGLPIGVMLACRPNDEATLLSLSAQLEAARPWSGRIPPLWSV
ncbi:amidase [Salinactinospora qingdaonensis]|uniref:Amidase n=1 Tax=Salinactinospora qingdaonensis TaxID=702744 RepID=A0ABP7EVY9_9ACTN